MKKVFALLLVLCCSSWLRADLLDDVSRQLDLLEKEYWLAMRTTSGDFHNSVQKHVSGLKKNTYKIIDVLRRTRKHNLVQLDQAINIISGNFERFRLRPAVISRFRFDFLKTSMSDYAPEFRRLLKDKELAEAQEDGTKGKRAKRNLRGVYPTLKTVDLIEYERWLAERLAANMEKFKKNNAHAFSNGKSSRRYRGYSNNEAEFMHHCVGEYLRAINVLRMGLVKIRQQTKTEFK